MTLLRHEEMRTEADVILNAEIIKKRLKWLEKAKIISIDSLDAIPIELLEDIREINDLIAEKMTLINNQRQLLKFGRKIQEEPQDHLIELMNLIDQFEIIRNQILEKTEV